MTKRTLSVIAIGLIAVITVSSLLIYANYVKNPDGSGILWQRSIQNFATGLATDNGQVFTMDISGNVNSYDGKNGNSIWNGNSVGGYFAADITISDGRVYGGYRDASVGCLNESNGLFQWSFISDVDHALAPDNIIVNDGQVLTLTEGVSPDVTSHNATTGQFLWQASYYYGYDSFGNITDSNTWWASGFPLVGDAFNGNVLYALGGNESSPNIFKLNTDNGSIFWHANVSIFSGIPSVLATYQGQVVIENGNQIQSFNDTSGVSLWSIDIGSSIYQPTLYKWVLYFGASDGNFYALDLRSSTVVSKTKVDNQSIFPMVNDSNTLVTYPIQVDPQNNRIYWSFGVIQQLGTTSENKHDHYLATLCSLDLATGKLMWDRQIEDSGVFYGFSAGLVVNRDSVFLNENNALWVFDASTGNFARNQHFDHYVLPPIISDNKVFVASDLQLAAYG